MSIDAGRLRDALAETAATHGPGSVGLGTERGEPVFEGAVGVTGLHDVLTSDNPFLGAALAAA